MSNPLTATTDMNLDIFLAVDFLSLCYISSLAQTSFFLTISSLAQTFFLTLSSDILKSAEIECTSIFSEIEISGVSTFNIHTINNLSMHEF